MDARAVGQRIKALREKRGMTQEDLAALVEISTTHMSVIEQRLKNSQIGILLWRLQMP